MIGTRLAHYEITEHLGTGGMGEVYQASDSKLGRSVAIKLLPQTFSLDAERVSRFQREARVLASLNHPNIAGIYGIEDDGKRFFLVLELVTGETLADRIQRGPVPVDEALGIASQIAAALETAHDAGIVHRDLKPANIRITPDGQVKVLDFGLAKAFAVDDSQASLSDSPTMTLAATRQGQILGTAAYMSPEHARGKHVDRRADIWAFGVVLYELVMGRRLFEGEDLPDILAAVVRDNPDFSVVPSPCRKLIAKCLEKDPRKRLGHISGYTLLLADSAPPQVSASKAKSQWTPWIVVGVATIALAALAFIHFRETEPELRSIQFAMEAPPESFFNNQYGGFAPSPDGRYIAFTARTKGPTQLWIRSLDSVTARELPGTDGANFPTWSPDSKSIAFLASGKLKRVEIAGGAAVTLGDAANDPVSPTGAWNRDGVILFGSSMGLQRVSAAGGGVTLLIKTDPDKKETGIGYPQFLPDGKRFLFFVVNNDPALQGVYASSLDAPDKRQMIMRSGNKAIYVPPHGAIPGYLLWLQGQTLLAQLFDVKALKLEGEPVSVAEQVGLNPNPNLSIRPAFWASDSGLLIYFDSPALRKRPLQWFSKDGRPSSSGAPEDSYVRIALSPNADRVAVSKNEVQGGKANRDIWVRELARDVMPRLTFDPADDDFPVWSPNGKTIAFTSAREGGVGQIYRKDASGAGQEERLTEGPYSKIVLDWSRDGKYLLYREENPKTSRDLLVLPLEGNAGDRKPIVFLNTPSAENAGAISPDGKWIAYNSNESGTNQIYIQAFPGLAGAPAGRWQISTNGAYDLKWRADGKELFFQSLDGKMMAAGLTATPQGIHAETARELFSADFSNGSLHEFDVTANGDRFLVILNSSSGGSNEHLTVVSNWQAALRK